MQESVTLDEPAPNRYPLSARQEDACRLADPSTFILPFALRIKGELRVDALEGALNDLVERHESLRTRITYDGADIQSGYQEILPPQPVPFSVRDISPDEERSRDDIADHLLAELNGQQLDISAVPSLRAVLYRFDDQDAVLTLLYHHALGDAWSSGLLRRELAACYKARVSGTAHALPVPVQYREYVPWERELLEGESGAAAREFWKDRLRGAEIHTMPADRPHGPGVLKSPKAARRFLIDPARFADVEATAGRARCTVWHLVLAAGMLLAKGIRGSSDVTLMTVHNGRVAKAFSNTVGFFAGAIPLRLNLADCATLRDVVALTRRTSLDAYRNLVPLEAILAGTPDLMKATEDPHSMPFVFNYVRPMVNPEDVQFADRVDTITLAKELPAREHRRFCVLNMTRLHSGEFACFIEYEPDLVDSDTVDRWGSEFVDLILSIADTPEASLPC